jgi:hypothetical protein
VKVTALPHNVGFARAANAGLEAYQGEFVFLLNNDTELEPCCLAELLAVIQADETLGMCAPKMVYAHDPSLINSAGHTCGPDGFVVDIGRGQPDGPWFQQPREVLGACGGAALYRRKMLDEIGLFDPLFYMSVEDVDLNWRARLAGWRCRYIPTAVVKHHEGVSRKIDSPRAVFLGLRNTIFVWMKDWPARVLIWHSCALSRGLLRTLVSLIKQGRGGTAFTALGAVLFHLPALLARRWRIQRKRVISNGQIEALLVLGRKHTRQPPED